MVGSSGSSSGSESDKGLDLQASGRPSHTGVNGASPAMATAAAANGVASSSSRRLGTHGVHFRDGTDRTVILRGVNLAASAKLPHGRPLHCIEDFWESAEEDGKAGRPGISYVGQTLNVEDGSADRHLARLRGWGFNCIRYVSVWEALEHEGPGIYDEAYMDDVVAVLRRCRAFGFYVYMDPHQDLFSRFCGGSGAPLWAIQACGLNPRNFTVTGAAYLHAEWPHPDRPDPASFPDMIWASNYSRLAVQTVNTLFWAGRDFAPLCMIDGVNIQEYLQSHFIAAYRRLATKLAAAGDLLDECVIGWDTINEPNHGYVGTSDLSTLPKKTVLRIGPSPTPFEGMRLGMGERTAVDNYRFGPIGSQRAGTVVIDPAGRCAWLDPDSEKDGSKYGWRRDPAWRLGTCVWALHGVWDTKTGALLKPDYFARSRHAKSGPADFSAEYWRPHAAEYTRQIRQEHPDAIIFVHPPVFEIPPPLAKVVPEFEHRTVFSSHFYDGLTLVTKHWNWFNADAIGILRGKYPSVVFGMKIGEAAIRRCLRQQLGVLKRDGLEKLGNRPFMMGEIGVPFDLDKKRAYRDGDYTNQVRALDASLNACDGDNMLSYTIWNYCSDNSHKWGDLWNGEDLSIWSPDDRAFQASSYLEYSKRHGKHLGRPHAHVYGPSTAKPAVFGLSTVSLPELANGLDDESLASHSVVDVNRQRVRVDTDTVHDGARALVAFCRPFPVKMCGNPVSFAFDLWTATFDLQLTSDPSKSGASDLETEIFVPAVHYGRVALPVSASLGLLQDAAPRHDDDVDLDLQVVVSAGTWRTEGQYLFWKHPPGLQTLQVKRASGALSLYGHHGGQAWRERRRIAPVIALLVVSLVGGITWAAVARAGVAGVGAA